MYLQRPRLSCVHEPPDRDPTAADWLLAALGPVLLLLFALTECQ